MNLIEDYIRELRDIRSMGEGVPETSHYSTLAHLLDGVGRTLKPRVRCIIQLKNQGAGLPDLGLFTQDQFDRTGSDEPRSGQLPSRGVVEVKPTSNDAWVTAEGGQVTRYWGKYRKVLVTNYRDFLLIGQDRTGKASKLESFRLAASDDEFWKLAAHPRKLANEKGPALTEYLKRVMLYETRIVAPEDLAWFLASYARTAMLRIEDAKLPALDGVRKAMESSLDIKFEGKKGEHFFRSTLVQSLFYGIFSAWVLWSQKFEPGSESEPFNWRTAVWQLNVPVIRALFEQVATPSKLEPLNLVEVLDWSTETLRRVDRTAFFATFQEDRAVQYFYEPFLEAFDPELRKELGVWYTPPEIVKYMVERVDSVLRTELNIPSGIADPRVYLLDPCCGTGTFLIEALQVIVKSLRAQGSDALLAQDVKKAALERIFGFEILPASFVIAHLQLGLFLQGIGASLSDSNAERASIFLTNALTGWEPAEASKANLQFHELEEERHAAGIVKQEKPILVIIGNPPYNAFAGVSPKEEKGLVEPYKSGLSEVWGVKKFNLDDLYIRFFRLAEKRIGEMTGKGLVCYISNHSWLSDTSFVVLREHLLGSFDRFLIDNLHGDRKISERAPNGKSSETIFAAKGVSPGIKQGVAISLWIKDGKSNKTRVLFRNDIDEARAAERRKQLLDSLACEDFEPFYSAVNPDIRNLFSFRPVDIGDEYLEWPRLIDVCSEPPCNGLMEKRAGSLIDMDREALARRMKLYYDANLDWETIKKQIAGLARDAARFIARDTRNKVLSLETYNERNILQYIVRPFDWQWCFHSNIRPLWNEPRPNLVAQSWEGNAFLISRRSAAKSPEGSPFYFSKAICDDHFLAPDAACFPIQLKAKRPRGAKGHHSNQGSFLDTEENASANLSEAARAYLASIGIAADYDEMEFAQMIWMHALAIGYSPAYLQENEDGVRQDWPRIPLPSEKEVFSSSVELGKRIAALLSEVPINGIDCGIVRPEFSRIAVISHRHGSSIDPAAGDLKISAGWGHIGKGGITAPGKGSMTKRIFEAEERAAFLLGVADCGLSSAETDSTLGYFTYDVYLNNNVFWKNIPGCVWEFYIGGYQVIKKWLSYRDFAVLGREILPEEARAVTSMARRIAALCLLRPMLDSNYMVAKKQAYAWPPIVQSQERLL